MRSLALLLLSLLAVGSILIECDTLSRPDDERSVGSPVTGLPEQWRRTVNGWERRSNWQSSKKLRHAPLPIHPLGLSTFLLIAAVAALALLRPRKGEKPDGGDRSC